MDISRGVFAGLVESGFGLNWEVLEPVGGVFMN